MPDRLGERPGQRRPPFIGRVGVLLLGVLLTAPSARALEVKILSFNVLSGGAAAAEVGLTSPLFRQPRHTNIAEVILQTGADIVCVNEPPGSPDPVLALLQERDPNWQRRGGSDGRVNIFLYARYPIEPDPLQPAVPTMHRVRVSPTQSVIVHTVHWWPARGYGPDYVQQRIQAGDLPPDPGHFASQVLARVSIPATYAATLAKVQPHLAAGRPVFVLGDFNEPSQLDWTTSYATTGPDRWVGNPFPTPLRPAIEWAGSKVLIAAGLKDAYREVFPDPVVKPGNTWTPPYANGTPGRRPYDGNITTTGTPNQVLARIDWILFAGAGVTVRNAAVVGENPAHAEHTGKSELVPEIQYPGPWPSDHRAVLAVFELEPISANRSGP